MIKLCAFADEANGSLQGQIEALKRNEIAYLELRNVNGKNVSAITLEEAKEYAEILKEKDVIDYSASLRRVKLFNDAGIKVRRIQEEDI